jgi:hypothetical protein
MKKWFLGAALIFILWAVAFYSYPRPKLPANAHHY